MPKTTAKSNDMAIATLTDAVHEGVKLLNETEFGAEDLWRIEALNVQLCRLIAAEIEAITRTLGPAGG